MERGGKVAGLARVGAEKDGSAQILPLQVSDWGGGRTAWRAVVRELADEHRTRAQAQVGARGSGR